MKSPTQLVDVRGNPINTRQLVNEQAGPNVRSVRTPFGEHPASNLTPGKLTSLLRNSISGDPMRYLELAEDMEERDLHYSGVLGIRKRQVSGLDVNVEAAGDDAKSIEIADTVRQAISRDSFEDELFDILDAIGKGFSATEIIWETSERQWMPKALKWRDPRWFTFDVEDGETLLLRGDNGEEQLEAYKWITHCAKAKSGLPIRGGLARVVAWAYFFKSFTLKDWAVFCETYGQPIRLGKYGANATNDEKSTLMKALSSIGTDFAGIVPDSMMIELVEAKVSGNHGLFEKRCNFIDMQISKVVLGQTGTTDAIAGGHAVGKIHDGVREDIERADAKQISATLNRDYVRPIVDLNFGPQKSYPKLTIGRPDEIDVDKLVNHVEKLVPLGLKVGMATMRDKIGLPDPDDEELLVVASSSNISEGVEPKSEPTIAKHGSVETQTLKQMDAVDLAARESLGGGNWEKVVKPLTNGLRNRLEDASSIEDARTILKQFAEDEITGMDETALHQHLAQMGFAAYLVGLAEEDVS